MAKKKYRYLSDKTNSYKKIKISNNELDEKLKYLMSITDVYIVNDIEAYCGKEMFIDEYFNSEKFTEKQYCKVFETLFKHPSIFIKESLIFYFETIVSDYNKPSLKRITKKVIETFFESFRNSDIYESTLINKDLVRYVFPFNSSSTCLQEEISEWILEELNKTEFSDINILKNILYRNCYHNFYYKDYDNAYLVNSAIDSYFEEIPGLPVEDFILEDNLDEYIKK